MVQQPSDFVSDSTKTVSALWAYLFYGSASDYVFVSSSLYAKESSRILCYSDANGGGDPDTHRSTPGYLWNIEMAPDCHPRRSVKISAVTEGHPTAGYDN